MADILEAYCLFSTLIAEYGITVLPLLEALCPKRWAVTTFTIMCIIQGFLAFGGLAGRLHDSGITWIITLLAILSQATIIGLLLGISCKKKKVWVYRMWWVWIGFGAIVLLVYVGLLVAITKGPFPLFPGVYITMVASSVINVVRLETWWRGSDSSSTASLQGQGSDSEGASPSPHCSQAEDSLRNVSVFEV